MEKQIALVNKLDQRVVNIIVVESLDKSFIQAWATDNLDVIAIKDSIAYVNGLWDGAEFSAPTQEYLVTIGLIQDNEA